MRTAYLRPFICTVILALVQTLLILQAPARDSASSDAVFRVAQAGGILKVYSNVKGARVFLNDSEIGKTPTIRLLSPGRYKVKLMLAGYETYEEEIDILANKAVTINAQLAKVVGSIEITANVDGAEVFLDDKSVGQTPNAALEDLPAGTYQIQIKKPGYTPYTGPITVKPNVRLKLRVELTPNAAVVNLTSSPDGVTVYMDDKPVGKTPVLLTNVSSGRHSLRFEREGYGTFFRVFQIAVGERLDINASMTAAMGGLRVKTRQEGAEVFLEGSSLGKSPLNTEETLQPGQYSLRISLPGHADHIQPVVIEQGRTTKVTADLVSLEVAQETGNSVGTHQSGMSTPLTKKWWFWTAVGGVAAAAAGGTAAVMLNQGSQQPTGDIPVSLP